MSKRIQYGQLMHKALRGLMAEVLSDVAENGLPGAHHFFITFDTTHPGVDMADYLIERNPETMTIVLQEWFADLSVSRERFAVTLNFSDTPEPLVVPFDAIRTFVDPSVEFGLRFDPAEEEDMVDEEAEDTPVIAEASDTAADPADAGGDVVSLDRFRKT